MSQQPGEGWSARRRVRVASLTQRLARFLAPISLAALLFVASTATPAAAQEPLPAEPQGEATAAQDAADTDGESATAAPGALLHETDTAPRPAAGEASPGASPAQGGWKPPLLGPSAATGGGVALAGPDTIILMDEQGRPRTLLNWQYEDFMRAWRQMQRLPSARAAPAFSLESMRIAGTTEDDIAHLRVELTVLLLSDEPVAVPLGFSNAVIKRAEAEQMVPITEQSQATEERQTADVGQAAGVEQNLQEGVARAVAEQNQRDATEDTTALTVHFTHDAQGGLVAWIDGGSGQRRTLNLELDVPLARNGEEVTLRLNCPRAVTSSLTLDVPAPLQPAETSDGTTLRQQAIGENGTRLVVGGLAGQYQLSWRSARAAAAELATVLSASGSLMVTIDNRSVHTEAVLSVESFGGGFDAFRVRLPPGANLREVDQEQPYTIVPEPNGDAAGGPIVLVRRPQRDTGPQEIRLSVEQPLGLEGTELSAQLGGFEVLGAVRQHGDIGIRVSDDWKLRWETGDYVRQVNPADLDSPLSERPLTSAFQYDRQPWTLRARVASRETRVHATPFYRMEIGPEEARLSTSFDYHIPGARTFQFRVDLRGWELTGEPIEPASLVDNDAVMVTPEGVLVLPLVEASSRQTEIVFHARRPVSGDELILPLPTPEVDATAAGELIVVPDPGLELTTDRAKLIGLSPEPLTPELLARRSRPGHRSAVAGDSPAESDTWRGNLPLSFRSFSREVTFAAKRATRPQQISVAAGARVQIDSGRVEVTQTFNYDIRHHPLTRLQWAAGDARLAEPERVEAVLVVSRANGEGEVVEDEIPLTLAAGTNGRQNGANASNRTDNNAEDEGISPSPTLQASTTPLLGEVRVRVRYSVPLPEAPEGSRDLPTAFAVPLLVPLDGTLTSSRAIIESAAGLFVQLDDDADALRWEESAATLSGEPYRAADAGVLNVTAAGEAHVLPLSVESSASASLPSTRIVRMWFQSWFTETVRQDRGVYLFTTDQREVTLELPLQVSAANVEVLLDRAPATVETREPGKLVVATEPGREHSLEVRYRRPADLAALSSRQLTPARLVASSDSGHFYWHVVLPAGTHLLGDPPSLSSASRWAPLEGSWGRMPLSDQAELERMAAASKQQQPTPSENQYLFSGLAPAGSISIVTVRRWLAVLIASGAVLLGGLCWQFLPAFARPGVLALSGLAVAALAVVYPWLAMMAGQAALLGVVLVAVAVAARRSFTPRQTAPGSTPGSTSAMLRQTSSDHYELPRPVGSRPGSSPAVPVRMSDSHS